MSAPFNAVNQRFEFEIFNDANPPVLFDPTPAPTVLLALKPDGSAMSPTPTLTHDGTGRYSYTLPLADMVDTWKIYVAVTDVSAFAPLYLAELEVQDIVASTRSALTAQGYTGARAGYIDILPDVQTDVDELQTTAATLATTVALSTAQTAISDIQTDVDELQVSVSNITVDTEAIADAVWDEGMAEHTAAGSFGLFFAGLVQTIVNGVLDVAASAHDVADSIGHAINLIMSGGVIVELISPLNDRGELEIIQGMDYYAADNNALVWTLKGSANLTGATCTFKGAGKTKAGTINATTRVATVELSKTESAAMTIGQQQRGILEVTLSNGHVIPATLMLLKVIPEPS